MIAEKAKPNMFHSLRKLFPPSTPAPHARRWQRIIMSEPARLTLPGGEIRSATLTQLSAGGACVSVTRRLRPGDLIHLDFGVGVGEHQSMNALIVHATKDQRGFNWLCGLCFVDAEPNGNRRIAEFVEAEQSRRKIGFAMPRA